MIAKCIVNLKGMGAASIISVACLKKKHTITVNHTKYLMHLLIVE